MMKQSASDNILAYHEAGHTVTKALKPGFFDFDSVTIASTGQEKGSFKVKNITNNPTKTQIANEMVSLMGGAAAEELTFGEQSLPLENTSDADKAYKLATYYIDHFGIPDNVDEMFIPSQDQKPSFLSGITSLFKKTALVTDENKENIKHEMMRAAFDKSYNLLEQNKASLDNVAEALIKNKELDKSSAIQIITQSTHLTGNLVNG